MKNSLVSCRLNLRGARLAIALLFLPLGISPASAAVPTFSAPVAGRAPDPVFATALGPAVADFDGDGALDFASVNAVSGSIFVSFGNADGSAKSTATSAGPATPVAVLAADLDADTHPDLVVMTAGAIFYYLNTNGTGVFLPASNIGLGIRAVSVAVADFDQDGYLDFIVSGDGDDGMGHTVGKLQVILSVSGGAFSGYDTPVDYGGGATAARVAVSDLNSDGYPDVVLARTAPTEGHGDVTVYFGNPNNFTANFLNSSPTPVSLAGDHHPVSIAIGDVTDDGKPDILVTSYVYPPNGHSLVLSFVDLLRNLADSVTAPTFQAGEFFYFDYAANNTPPLSDVKIGDIDGDGVNDFAAIQSLGVNLCVFRVSPVMDENSVYQSLHEDAKDVFALNTTPLQFALGKLNNDNFPDVIVAHGNQGGLTTLLNTTPLTEAGPIAKAIQFDKGAYTVNEGVPGQSGTPPVDVVVKRAADSTGSVTLNFSVGGTASPNGSARSDYLLVADNQPFKPKQTSGTLTFAPNEFEKHIILSISTDPGSEPDETIVLSLQKLTGDAVLGPPRVATVTIKDSEPPALRGGNKLTAKPKMPLKLTPADKANGVKVAGRTPESWSFTTSETKDANAPGLSIKLQASVTAPPNETWVDIGTMRRPGGKGTKWEANGVVVPPGDQVFLRTVSTATNLTSGIGLASAPVRATASPVIEVSIKPEPAGHIASNAETFPEEAMTYRLTYKNVSTVPADHVVIGVQIPMGTHSDNGTGSPGIQFLTDHETNETAAYFELGTVPAGISGTCLVNVVVDPEVFDPKPNPTPPHLKQNKRTMTGVRLGFPNRKNRKFTSLFSFTPAQATYSPLAIAFEEKGISVDEGGAAGLLKKDPELTFVYGSAVYGAYWDDPIPATKPKPLSTGGPEAITPLNPPIVITTVANKTEVDLDGTITYTVMLHNNSSSILQNVVYRNQVPFGTTFESAHTSDGNGNFNQPPISNFTPFTNPALSAFQFGKAERVITWTIPLIPAGEVREIKFTVRMIFDKITDYIDPAGVRHTAAVVNAFYDVTAVTASARTYRAVSFQPGDKPFRTLVRSELADQQPQLRLEKEVEGLGKGRGQLRGEKDPKHKTDENPLGLIASDVETVLRGDDLKYTVHFENSGDPGHPTVSTAVDCIIQEELSKEVVFNGGIKIGGVVDVTLPDARFVLRDQKGVVLPYNGHSLTQDFSAVRVIEYRLGNLTGNSSSNFSYRATPTVGSGKFVYSRGCRIWTRSLTLAKHLKQQVVAKVVEPITFDPTSKRHVSEPVSEGSLVTFTASIRNNGGIQALNVQTTIPIPAFTTYQAGSAVSANSQVPVNIAEVQNGHGDVTALTLTFATLEAQVTNPGANPKDTGRVTFRVKVADDFPVKQGSLEGQFLLKFGKVTGQYSSGAAAMLGRIGRAPGDDKVTIVMDDTGRSALSTRVRIGPKGPNLWAFKQYPLYVTAGQKMVYTIGFGNSGTQPVPKVRVGMFIPDHTTLDKNYTTTGYAPIAGQPFDKLFWEVGDLQPHESRTFFVVLDVLPGAIFPRDTMAENSCAVDSDAFIQDSKTGKLINMNAVPGPARTTVYSDHPVVGTWQAFCSFLQSIGANLFGKGTPEIKSNVHQFGTNSIGTTLRGADAIVLPTGLFVIQNGGGNIVAAGGGNLIGGDGASIVAAGGGNIVAAGGGNLLGKGGAGIVAAGGGNIVAAGGGNLISVQGIGFCNQANILAKVQSIVAGGGGNIVAAGGGNLVRIDNGIATLIGLDGASVRDGSNNLITLDRNGPGIIDGGGGNSLISGSGILSAGEFNEAAPLLAGPRGAAVVVLPDGVGTFAVAANPVMPLVSVVANDGAGVVANDGSGITPGKDGSALITDKGSGIGLIGGDGASLIGGDGASLIGGDGASVIDKSGANILNQDNAGILNQDNAGFAPITP